MPVQPPPPGMSGREGTPLGDTGREMHRGVSGASQASGGHLPGVPGATEVGRQESDPVRVPEGRPDADACRIYH
jgi:hypothetical protein